MKKQINKIILIFLLFTIFTMAKGLCFQDLLNSGFKVNVAQAETLGLDTPGMNTETNIDLGVCGGTDKNSSDSVQNNIWSSGMDSMLSSYDNIQSSQVKPFSNHNKSLLPCCLDENHPTAIVSSNSVDLEKFVPQIFFNTEKIQFVSSEPSYYEAPITAPPELYSIQKTILRL